MTKTPPQACVVLPCEPRSASAARRFAMRTLHQWNSEDEGDVVELLLSEVVTNALLHTSSPVEVCLVRDFQGIRVAVADGSPALPSQRHWADDASTGRGLALVEALASGWGVELVDGGKVVWFTVGAAESTGRVDALAPFDVAARGLDARDGDQATTCEIALDGAPVLLFEAMHRHLEAVLREWALLGGSGETWQPPRLDVDLSAASRALGAAGDAGRSTADVKVTVASSSHSRERFAALRHTVHEADRLARAGQMLTPPALPEIQASIEWFFTQIISQLDGETPTAWRAPDAVHTTPRSPLDAKAVLDALAAAAVVADDGNRIVYANAAAEDLLGWDAGALAGQRLIAIIPERLRDAHIAGYSRYQLTREPRLIGTAVQVPALRRDGSEVQVSLHLSVMGGGGAAFVASMTPVERADRGSAVYASQTLHALAGARDGAVDDILGTLAAAAGWNAACWWRVDADKLRCVATWSDRAGAYHAFIDATRAAAFTKGAGLPGRVWESGQVAWIPDVVADSNFARSGAAAASGLRSACAFPVGTTDVVGVVEMFAPGIRATDDELVAAYAVGGPLLSRLAV